MITINLLNVFSKNRWLMMNFVFIFVYLSYLSFLNISAMTQSKQMQACFFGNIPGAQQIDKDYELNRFSNGKAINF